jgi:hypothetical protein
VTNNYGKENAWLHADKTDFTFKLRYEGDGDDQKQVRRYEREGGDVVCKVEVVVERSVRLARTDRGGRDQGCEV